MTTSPTNYDDLALAEALAAGVETYRQVAERFSLSYRTVLRIVNGQTRLRLQQDIRDVRRAMREEALRVGMAYVKPLLIKHIQAGLEGNDETARKCREYVLDRFLPNPPEDEPPSSSEDEPPNPPQDGPHDGLPGTPPGDNQPDTVPHDNPRKPQRDNSPDTVPRDGPPDTPPRDNPPGTPQRDNVIHTAWGDIPPHWSLKDAPPDWSPKDPWPLFLTAEDLDAIALARGYPPEGPPPDTPWPPIWLTGEDLEAMADASGFPRDDEPTPCRGPGGEPVLPRARFYETTPSQPPDAEPTPHRPPDAEPTPSRPPNAPTEQGRGGVPPGSRGRGGP